MTMNVKKTALHTEQSSFRKFQDKRSHCMSSPRRPVKLKNLRLQVFHAGPTEYEQREGSFVVRESNLKEFHFVKKKQTKREKGERGRVCSYNTQARVDVFHVFYARR